MDTSTDSFMDDLAARTTIKDYGNISIVTIPGCSTLSESERTAVFNKAQQRHMATPLDANILLSRLRCITPPLDEEEDNEESRLLEAQARKQLENDGCPPCYPPCLDIPLRPPFEEYQAIIDYWQSFPGTDGVVLCAQLSDWQKFRRSQLRVRRRYRNKPFSEFVDEVRKRRQSHQLGGDIRLLLDPGQQSRLENWMEFQNYHLKRLELFEKKRDELKELHDTQKKAADTDTAGSARAAEEAEAVLHLSGFAERSLERHKVLLQWIEQERRAMDIAYPTSIEEDNDEQGDAPQAVEEGNDEQGDTPQAVEEGNNEQGDAPQAIEEGNNEQGDTPQAIRRSSTRGRHMRRPEASAVLGKVRVSKPKKRNTQAQKPKAPGLEPVIQDSDVIPLTSIPRAPKRRETKP